jgi:hypothetical protein
MNATMFLMNVLVQSREAAFRVPSYISAQVSHKYFLASVLCWPLGILIHFHTVVIKNIFHLQLEITEAMRSILVDWLVEVRNFDFFISLSSTYLTGYRTETFSFTYFI